MMDGNVTASRRERELPTEGPIARLGAWVEGKAFQRFIVTLIILNAISLGLETSATVMEAVGPVLRAFDSIVLGIFCFEIGAKLAWRRLGFFRNGWNVFDIVIVGIALLPATGPLAVLRALRVLRLLRLLSVVPQMRRVIGALLHAIPGMTTVLAIILLLFYVGAVLSTKLFGASFEDWFGTIGRSMYTLFQVMTLESWSMGIVRPVMEQYPYAWMFFLPFIMVTTFAVLNLFVGIVVDAMREVHAEEESEVLDKEPDLASEVRALRAELAELKAMLQDRR
ncbi:ion transporter [Telmatospirillum sp. J64-1]|uniref:ion transporter n=1 Tax=Telmatospirillum sp. J64-1 TaxID=2502183 RepID=UPI002104CDC1|nr:ion transporter [Telmatospirillum sp. J64-1]